MDRTQRNAFTLVELLVVISIVAFLIAVLLPTVGAARESGRRTFCSNNMRNLGIATLGHLNAKDAFPPAAQVRWGGKLDRDHPPDPARHSVITFLLPYFGQSGVFDRFDLRWDWNDTTFSNNDAVSKQNLGGILICPSAPGGREAKHVSDYTGAVRIDPTLTSGLGPLIHQGLVTNRAIGSNAPNFGNKRREWDGVLQLYAVTHSPRLQENRRMVRHAHVRDGLSNTFLLFEDAGKPDCYWNGQYQGTGSDCGSVRFRWASWNLYMTINDFCHGAKMMNCNNNSQPYGFHRGGGNFVMADASVHFVAEEIEPETFVSLFTLAAGDVGSIND